MTLFEQMNDQVIEEIVSEMSNSLGLKLCYFGDDNTWGLHSIETGEVAFINGHTYFSSLEELLEVLLTTGRIAIYLGNSAFDDKVLIQNIFQGCTSLEEIRLKIDLYNRST